MTRLQRLQEENETLRALTGKCIKCGNERDAADTIRVEAWESFGGYFAVAWFGGGVSGKGKTKPAAIWDAIEHLSEWCEREGARALKRKPWRRAVKRGGK